MDGIHQGRTLMIVKLQLLQIRAGEAECGDPLLVEADAAEAAAVAEHKGPKVNIRGLVTFAGNVYHLLGVLAFGQEMR